MFLTKYIEDTHMYCIKQKKHMDIDEKNILGYHN
jgi:hypothetical protein